MHTFTHQIAAVRVMQIFQQRCGIEPGNVAGASLFMTLTQARQDILIEKAPSAEDSQTILYCICNASTVYVTLLDREMSHRVTAYHLWSSDNRVDTACMVLISLDHRRSTDCPAHIDVAHS